MAIATFIENDFGTGTAWKVIYDAWWFEMVMLGLGICFIFNIFKYNLWTLKKWPILLFHLSFIIILIGASITRYSSYGGIMRIREGASSNVIISSNKYIHIHLTDGETTKSISKQINFSPISDNYFSIDDEINNIPVTVSYNNFIADAVSEIVEDKTNGKPIIQMVVSSGKGRETVFLEKGEIEAIGAHKHKVGFESDQEGIINISEKDGVFKIYSPRDLSSFVMATETASTIKKDSLHSLELKTLYRDGDASFVPLSYHPKGNISLVSGAEKPKDNDELKDDALVVNVKANKEVKETTLLYRQGFLPTEHKVDFDKIKVSLSYGSKPIQTPFSIHLDDFQLERYPGSTSPSAYASEVQVIDGENRFLHRIFMNNVLDYKGFRFFQASYDTDELGTVLAVNHDALGTNVTYLGYFLMMIGMFFTLFGKGSRFTLINQKLKKLKNKTTLILLLLLSISSLSFSQKKNPKINIQTIKQQTVDIQHADLFGRLMVQDLDGRIKPLNTLASEFLRKLSRKPYFKFTKNGESITLNANQAFLAMQAAANVWQYIPIIKVDKEKGGKLFAELTISEDNYVSFIGLLDTDGNYKLKEVVEEGLQHIVDVVKAYDDINMKLSEPMSDDDGFIALNVTTSLLSSHIQVNEAALFVDQDVEIDGQTVRVKSSLQRLKEEAFKYDLAYYSEQCEIPQDQIIALAKRFTSYGTKAVVDTHGGNMHTNGFYNSFSILMLNALIGNINAKGGAMAKAGGYPTSVAGPRYDFTKFKGKTKPQGVFLSRSKFPYHKTSEYKRRVAAGESPYPTRAPWYPISAPLLTEHLSAAIDGYPYRAKAWINHMANPLYGVPGLDNLLGEKLKDPKQLGLIVSIDAFINETTALSDYLVPDTVTYESWGMATPWHGVATKAITARWPIVEPKTSRTQDGRAINLENFFIDLAKTLDLGGFGENAIKDSQGNWHGIYSAEDFYLRSAANLAFAKCGVPNVDAEDIVWSGLERLVPVMNKTLKPEEMLKVAYIFARGGRFEDATNAYTNETMKYKWTKPLAIWNEKLGTSRNTISGEQYMGCPTWYPQKLADGTPLAEQFPAKEWPFTLTNFKSNIHSAVSNLSPRLESIKGVNPVYIHPQDASSAGIKTGDVFAIETPSSTTHALAMVIDGIKPGTLGFEHGFGHKELGERAHWIGDTQQPVKMKSNDGVNINDIGLIDPTREGKGVMLDWVVGAAARQALPAKIYKV
ncbi:cytochrome c biogenesis protein ResB [uncultured Pseudoalteromonas sp.]|uniref:cytochrome c biogenesis protein ResB n=4 Tax=Gammaproteobacteria TaxID=1236 RepID=UPI002599CE16|nr:cytochrome c biogenesis protein ResB [uncultured Pseudoalteromonas sp.]